MEQRELKSKRNCSPSRRIVMIAIMAAVLIAGKFALAAIPNVEVVTLFVIVFAFTVRWDTLWATLVFCTVDLILYPPSPDVIVSYYIYWNLLAAVVALTATLGVRNEYVYLGIGLVMTLFFGVLTSLCTSVMLGTSFVAIYAAGLVFYALQCASALVTMLVGFKPLSNLVSKAWKKYL